MADQINPDLAAVARALYCTVDCYICQAAARRALAADPVRAAMIEALQDTVLLCKSQSLPIAAKAFEFIIARAAAQVKP